MADTAKNVADGTKTRRHEDSCQVHHTYPQAQHQELEVRHAMQHADEKDGGPEENGGYGVADVEIAKGRENPGVKNLLDCCYALCGICGARASRSRRRACHWH